MKIKEILRNLINYYVYNRAVGHTHLMLHGVKQQELPCKVLVSNRGHGKGIGLKDSQILTIESFENKNFTCLAGLRSPLAVDNFALQMILTQAFNYICDLENQIKGLETEKQKGRL